MVRTAIIQRNTSAMSTDGLRGEYSCTDTAKWQKNLEAPLPQRKNKNRSCIAITESSHKH